MGDQDGFELKLAVFLVGGQPYAIDIMKIKQIIRPMKITPLPRAPDFVEGVINLRGVVIPLIDMRKRFSLPGAENQEDAKVIIAAVDRKVVGLMVDDVLEVISVPKSELQPPPRVVRGVEADYLEGVCRYKDDILLILNLDEILSAEEKISLAELGRAKTKPETRTSKKG